MQQQEVKPYVLITIIMLAILMAFGVFLTMMYLQRRSPNNANVVVVEGQEIVVNPVPGSEVVIVPQEGQGGAETVIVEPVVAQPVEQIVLTNTPEPPTPVPVPATAVPTEMYIFTYHTVTSADTLYSLARLYNTSIPLMARFGISSTVMVVGNTLSIPVANPAYCPGHQTSVAIEGDTPLGFSSSAGITLDEFWAINPLANNAIYETQVVCLP